MLTVRVENNDFFYMVHIILTMLYLKYYYIQPYSDYVSSSSSEDEEEPEPVPEPEPEPEPIVEPIPDVKQGAVCHPPVLYLAIIWLTT